jgi:hypothetical protein
LFFSSNRVSLSGGRKDKKNVVELYLGFRWTTFEFERNDWGSSDQGTGWISFRISRTTTAIVIVIVIAIVLAIPIAITI